MNTQFQPSSPQVVYYGGAHPTAAATSSAQITLGGGTRQDQQTAVGGKVFFASSSQHPAPSTNEYYSPGVGAGPKVFTVGSSFQQQQPQVQTQSYMQPTLTQLPQSINYAPTQYGQQGGYYAGQPQQQPQMVNLSQQPYQGYQHPQQAQMITYQNQPQVAAGNQPRFAATTAIGGAAPLSPYGTQQYGNLPGPRMAYSQQASDIGQPMQRQGVIVHPKDQQVYQQQPVIPTIQPQRQTGAHMEVRSTTQQNIGRRSEGPQRNQPPKMRELQPRQRQSMDRPEVIGPPQFITHPVPQITIVEGEGCTIKALLQPAGDPTLEVKWLKSGEVLNASSRSYASIDRGYAAFQILYTNPTDSGEYCCIATNSQGQAQSTGCKITVIPEAGVVTHTQLPEESMIANITAMEMHMASAETPQGPEEKRFDQPPTFLRQLQPQLNVRENERAKFETYVQPANDPSLVVEWYKDGRPLNTGCRFTTTMDRGFAILDIHYCYPEDSGDYMCVAQNAAGRAQSNAARLTCKPTASIVTNSVLSDSSISYLQNLDAHNTSDATQYEQRYQETEEMPTAPTFEITPNETVVIEGSPVRLLVKAGGFPHPDLHWLINGDLLPPNGDGGAWSIYSDGGISYLELHRAGPPGEYQVTVVAENSVGKVSTNTILVVDPQPDYRPDLKHIAPENPFRKMGQLKHVERMPELDSAFSKRRANVQDLKRLERKSVQPSFETIETENLYNRVQATLRTSRKVSMPSMDQQQQNAVQTQQAQSVHSEQKLPQQTRQQAHVMTQGQPSLQQPQKNQVQQPIHQAPHGQMQRSVQAPQQGQTQRPMQTPQQNQTYQQVQHPQQIQRQMQQTQQNQTYQHAQHPQQMQYSMQQPQQNQPHHQVQHPHQTQHTMQPSQQNQTYQQIQNSQQNQISRPMQQQLNNQMLQPQVQMQQKSAQYQQQTQVNTTQSQQQNIQIRTQVVQQTVPQTQQAPMLFAQNQQKQIQEQEKRQREQEQRQKEEEQHHREQERRRMEEEQRRKEEEHKQREIEQRRKQEEMRKMEEEQRRMEEEQRRKTEDQRKIAQEQLRIEQERQRQIEDQQRIQREVNARRLVEEEEARRIQNEARIQQERKAVEIHRQQQEALEEANRQQQVRIEQQSSEQIIQQYEAEDGNLQYTVEETETKQVDIEHTVGDVIIRSSESNKEPEDVKELTEREQDVTFDQSIPGTTEYDQQSTEVTLEI